MTYIVTIIHWRGNITTCRVKADSATQSKAAALRKIAPRHWPTIRTMKAKRA